MKNLSYYIYGTTRLGDESIPRADRIAIAQQAIQSVGWIHTSHQYGEAQQVLKEAVDGLGVELPPVICKIGWESVDQIRDQIKLQNDALGIKQMAIGQLCLGGALAESFQNGDVHQEDLLRLRDEGIVDRFLVEMWPWNSEVALGALRNGRANDLVDGFIFYCNPLQRFVTNELWDLLQDENQAIIAMRTVSGGSLSHLQSNPSAPEYLRKRAGELAPVFEASECESWTEFCIRFVAGLPQVKATVGSTSRAENLTQFVELSKNPQPLAKEVHNQILALHRKWSDEHDQFAAPWSM